jgi:hypothetical protein
LGLIAWAAFDPLRLFACRGPRLHSRHQLAAVRRTTGEDIPCSDVAPDEKLKRGHSPPAGVSCRTAHIMLIRYGYDIAITCTEPTPMVCLLGVHPERAADVRSVAQMVTRPEVAITTYRDLYGNLCRRLVAPPGDFTLAEDGTIEDHGNPTRSISPSPTCRTTASSI